LSIPTAGGTPHVSDAGLETEMLFNHGFDLPEFAAFPHLESDKGLEFFENYYRSFADIARAANAALVLCSPTWRANPDWAARLGYDAAALDRINQASIGFLKSLRTSLEGINDGAIAGAIGPRGDGYAVGEIPDLDEAKAYHRPQIESFAKAGADLVEAMTITNVNEAAGIVMAANQMGIPVLISFTVETDGRLPDGSTLADAITRVDNIGEVTFFGVNCAYPDHILPGLTHGPWINRIGEVRPNASSKTHAELDESGELDPGDIDDLARGFDELRSPLPNLTVVGGCCGSNHEHVARLWNVG
jgi:S-methylmethionine-dependent homocysteine/selenocysteine methylase